MSMMQRSESPTLVPSEALRIEDAALRAVAYADVFDYPLRATEIHRYLHGVVATPEATAMALAGCGAPGAALRLREGFYTLVGREGLVDVRRRRAACAERLWPRAVSFGRIIAGLPFVRMVAVTGSLAWDNVERGSDIDYVVVTEPGRVWLCRWLIAALVRLVRLGGVRLCANYVLSTRALGLDDRNLYVAYELARMTPIAGRGTYRRMRRANAWSEAYLPNAMQPPRPPVAEVPPTPRWLSRALARVARLGERALRSPVGSVLERFEMTYRVGKRTRKQGRSAEAAFGPDWFKDHSGYRQRALAVFAARLRDLGAPPP